MTGKFYKVQNLAPGFDGLVVQAEQSLDNDKYFVVSRIIEENSFNGDRLVSVQIPLHSLLIHSDNLALSEDQGVATRQFASDNPYGKFILEGRMDLGSVRVTYSRYEKALQVTIFDTIANKTVVSQNFYKNFEHVIDSIEQCLKEGDQSGEDLVFKLVELKEMESNG